MLSFWSFSFWTGCPAMRSWWTIITNWNPKRDSDGGPWGRQEAEDVAQRKKRHSGSSCSRLWSTKTCLLVDELLSSQLGQLFPPRLRELYGLSHERKKGSFPRRGGGRGVPLEKFLGLWVKEGRLWVWNGFMICRVRVFDKTIKPPNHANFE